MPCASLHETARRVTCTPLLSSPIRCVRILLCQNNYSLLCRADTELGTMPETVSRQNANVGFLAYSPLAGGCVSRHHVPSLSRLEDDPHPFLTVSGDHVGRSPIHACKIMKAYPSRIYCSATLTRVFCLLTGLGIQLRLSCPRHRAVAGSQPKCRGGALQQKF